MAELTNPVLAIERLLEGKTTLKTQRITHENIVCLGTELLDHVQKLMNEDKDRAVKEAVEETKKNANAKLYSEIELLQQILSDEKERELEAQRQEAEKKMANLQRQCEVAEKKRAREAYEKYQTEKRQALEDLAEKARQEREKTIEVAIEKLTAKLNKEADIARDEAIKEALKEARQGNRKTKKVIKVSFDEEKEDAIQEAQTRCKNEYKKQLQEMQNEHTANLGDLEEREFTDNM